MAYLQYCILIISLFVIQLHCVISKDDLWNLVQSDENAATISKLVAENPKIVNEYIYNRMPLHLAANSGALEIARILIGAGADVNAKTGNRCIENNTPLHMAAEVNEANMVGFLVANGALVDAKDALGRTPLHRASRSGAIHAVYTLLNRGAQVNSIDNYGSRPVDAALCGNYQEIERVLRSWGGTAFGENKKS